MRAYGAASSGVTSGVGLAIAKTIAPSFIRAGASAGSTRAPDRPMNRSAPSMTSAGEPARRSGFELSAYQRLIAFIEPSRESARPVAPAPRVHRPAGVAADDVAHAGREQDLRDRAPRRAEADDEDVQVLQPLAG